MPPPLKVPSPEARAAVGKGPVFVSRALPPDHTQLDAHTITFVVPHTTAASATSILVLDHPLTLQLAQPCGTDAGHIAGVRVHGVVRTVVRGVHRHRQPALTTVVGRGRVEVVTEDDARRGAGEHARLTGWGDEWVL